MKSSAFYAVIGAGVLVVIAVVWWGFALRHSPVVEPSALHSTYTSSTTPLLTGLSIYTNGQYGFSIMYTQADTLTNAFDASYFVATTWRVNALPQATGTPIAQIVGYHITNTSSFPRYFTAEVRIGASQNREEVAACDNVSNGETALPGITINGVVWKAFSLQDDGMMQYMKGVSYRTVHDDACYALEQLETGSSYQDDPPSAHDIPQSTLDQHYNDLATIVQSFRFARP